MPKVRGEGSIIQLDKSVPRSKCRLWELRVSVGRDKGSGKYPPMTRRFHGTLSEAKKAKREFIAEIERGSIVRRSDMVFGEYSDAWCEERKASKAYGTWRRDVDRMKCLKLHLASAKLQEVTPELLEDVYAKLMDGKSPSGKKLSPNYVCDIHTTAHRMFKDAVKDKHIATNPCDYAERPKRVETKHRTIRAAGMRELIDMLDPSHPTELSIIIMLRTGMRRGEAHGLSWGDIDFADNVIHIVHGYTDNGELGDTKTSNGVRDIPLPRLLAETLLEAKKRQEDVFCEIRERFGTDTPIMDDATPVICNELGERLLPHSTTTWWDRHRGEYGLDGIKIHEMRHSYLSEMARRKMDPKVLQSLAGHAKFDTTMDIYVQVQLEDKMQAMEKMDW